MFGSLRKEIPDFATKIVPLLGDAANPGLGLSSEDRAIITREVKAR